MKVQILSLFPDYFTSPLKEGLLAKALSQSLLDVSITNPRDFSESKTSRVDDYPFGGGDSMILCYEPLAKSLKSLKEKGHVISLSPSGTLWNAKKAKQFSKEHKTLTLVCGRYGGIDQRFVTEFVDESISVGDYVLNGGEVASLILIESLFRFLPQALGNEISCEQESFEGDGLLECPQWTRPQEVIPQNATSQNANPQNTNPQKTPQEVTPKNASSQNASSQNTISHKIPQVLLSGHHADIQQFKKDCSLLITAVRRPDLFPQHLFSQLKQAQKNLLKLDSEELKALDLNKQDLNKNFEDLEKIK